MSIEKHLSYHHLSITTCTTPLLNNLHREANLHLRIPTTINAEGNECWIQLSITSLQAQKTEIVRVTTRLRLLALRIEHILDTASYKRHLVGMLLNTRSAANDLYDTCTNACDLFSSIYQLLRNNDKDDEDAKLVYDNFELIRSLNTLGRRNSSFLSHLRSVQRLLAENGFAILYEQPAGILLPGECCNHDDAALHYPRCSAVTELMPDFPVY